MLSGDGPGGWVLPEAMQETTGVVYATSFPALDAAVMEVSSFFQSQLARQASVPHMIGVLREKLLLKSGADSASAELDGALSLLEAQLESSQPQQEEAPVKPYEFDRKFLFRVLVLGNAQLAQIIKARGPNMQTNAACAGNIFLSQFQ